MIKRFIPAVLLLILFAALALLQVYTSRFFNHISPYLFAAVYWLLGGMLLLVINLFAIVIGILLEEEI